MSSRISAGFTASTLALAAGGISVSLSLIVAAIIFFVLSFVFAILTFAHRLPLLHRLPEVGAPKIDVTLHQEVASPNGVVVQVGIRSPTRLDDSVFVFLAPDDVPVVPSDHQGTPLPAGPPMLPTSERVVPYTNSHHWTAPLDLRRGSNLAWFALGPCPAGHRSRIRIKLDSEKLYRGFIVTSGDIYFPYPEGLQQQEQESQVLLGTETPPPTNDGTEEEGDQEQQRKGDDDLTTPSEPEIPPPPRATHRVMQGVVELRVRVGPQLFSGGAVTCEVTDPQGLVTRATTNPRAPQGLLSGAFLLTAPRTAVLLFPTEFGRAEPLYPGAYHVVWSIPRSPMSGGIFMGPEEVHDAFRVRPRPSEEDQGK